jgi:hypothetical protein
MKEDRNASGRIISRTLSRRNLGQARVLGSGIKEVIREWKKLFMDFMGCTFISRFPGWPGNGKDFLRKMRRKEGGMLHQINLAPISWKRCTDLRLPRIWEQENGNIRISELGIINMIAETCEDESNIFEIGTFDGRTTINLAFSSPSNCRIFTLDLKPEMETVYSLESGVRWTGLSRPFFSLS